MSKTLVSLYLEVEDRDEFKKAVRKSEKDTGDIFHDMLDAYKNKLKKEGQVKC